MFWEKDCSVTDHISEYTSFWSLLAESHAHGRCVAIYFILFIYFMWVCVAIFELLNKLPHIQLLTVIPIYYLTFLQSDIWIGLTWFLGLTSLKPRCRLGQVLIQRLWEESAFQFFHVVGRIQFHVAVGLWSPLHSWLLAGGCSRSLETAFWP